MPNNKKLISVITSTRAEYGLLVWLMKEIEKSPFLNLDLVVTGTHLDANYGSTYKFIEEDGFKINEKINISSKSYDVNGIGETAANALMKFTKYFSKRKPNAVILLGDRYEIMAIAQSAAIVGIPVIHLHGGEISEGANDDMFRHAITKLSSFHFTSSNIHRQRVIQMGEMPNTVKVSGALGIDNIKKLKLFGLKELEKLFSFKFNKNIFLVTFHPATMEKESVEDQFLSLLQSLKTFKHTSFVISKANSDAGGNKINVLIDNFSKNNPNVLTRASFGQLNYLSLMKLADVVIGNSSSGIIEAPSLETPTVNIGTRQKGRLCAKSVIHCSVKSNEIKKAILNALKIRGKKYFNNPYDHGSASVKIVKVIENLNFDKLLPKKFYDIK